METIDNKKLIKTVFFWTFVLGIAAHIYSYTNLMYSHDSLLIFQDDFKWSYIVGRFIAPIYLTIRGKFYPPALVGFLSLAYIALSVFILVKLFDIKKYWQIVFTCGVLTTNVTVTLLNATYMHDVDRYMMALLLIVSGTYICRKFKFGFIPASLLLCLSLGLYQGYIEVAIVLFIILGITDILDNISFKDTLISGIKGIISILTGLLLYKAGSAYALAKSGYEYVETYNDISSVGSYENIGEIIKYLKESYIYVFDYFKSPVTYGSSVIAIINIILLIFLIISLWLIIKVRKIKLSNLILGLVLLILLPLGMNAVYFMSKGLIHELMIYSFFFVYVFEFIVIGKAQGYIPNISFDISGVVVKIITVLFIVMMFCNINYSNSVYLQKDLEYKNTENVFNRIISRVEETEGFEIGTTPIVFVGLLNNGPISKDRPYFDEESVGLSNNFAVTYYETYENYFNRLISYPCPVIDQYEAPSWALKEEVIQMSPYPAKDSCKIVDGVMVIKLSD